MKLNVTPCVFPGNQIEVLNAIGDSDIVLYCLLFLFWLYNCNWLLYKKGRWRNEQIVLFYGFSVLIIVCRILMLCFWARKKGDVGDVAFYFTDLVANYSWICLGIC